MTASAKKTAGSSDAGRLREIRNDRGWMVGTSTTNQMIANTATAVVDQGIDAAISAG
jgi:hypothetical protein